MVNHRNRTDLPSPVIRSERSLSSGLEGCKFGLQANSRPGKKPATALRKSGEIREADCWPKGVCQFV